MLYTEQDTVLIRHYHNSRGLQGKICLRCIELPLVVNVSFKKAEAVHCGIDFAILLYMYSVYRHYSIRLSAIMHEDHYFSLLARILEDPSGPCKDL